MAKTKKKIVKKPSKKKVVKKLARLRPANAGSGLARGKAAKKIVKSGYGHRGDQHRRRGYIRKLPHSNKKVRVKPCLVKN